MFATYQPGKLNIFLEPAPGRDEIIFNLLDNGSGKPENVIAKAPALEQNQ